MPGCCFAKHAYLFRGLSIVGPVFSSELREVARDGRGEGQTERVKMTPAPAHSFDSLRVAVWGYATIYLHFSPHRLSNVEFHE